MRIFAVSNRKGGCGKTATAVNIASILGERGHKVLVLDLDSQCNATAWLQGRVTASRDLFDALAEEGDLGTLIEETNAKNVDIIPGSPFLVGADRALVSMGAETVLRDILKPVLGPYEFAFIDCPPGLGILVSSALCAADEVLVPVKADAFGLVGVETLETTIERARKSGLNPNLRISAVLACFVRRQTNLWKAVHDSLEVKFGDVFLKANIRDNVQLGEAPSHALPINYYAPWSNGANDYCAAADELVPEKGA